MLAAAAGVAVGVAADGGGAVGLLLTAVAATFAAVEFVTVVAAPRELLDEDVAGVEFVGGGGAAVLVSEDEEDAAVSGRTLSSMTISPSEPGESGGAEKTSLLVVASAFAFLDFVSPAAAFCAPPFDDGAGVVV